MFINLSPGAVHIQCGWIEGLDLAREAGFEGADLNLAEAEKLAAEKDAAAVRALYEELGLKIGGWGFPVSWRGSDADYYESLARLPAQAALAAEIGCFRTMTWVLPFSDELTRREHFDRVTHRFRLAAEILAEHGHSLGLEFVGPRNSRTGHKHGLVYSMDGMLALCCAIGMPNVGLLFDVWHWWTCRSTLDDLRQLSAEDIVYVHLNDAPAGIDVLDQVDNQRCLPGQTGVIPAAAALRILDEIGYDGPVTAEPFNQALREVAQRDKLQAARLTRASIEGVFRDAGLLQPS